MNTITGSTAGRMLDTTPQTLVYYAQKGRLNVMRLPNGTRLYLRDEIEALARARKAARAKARARAKAKAKKRRTP